jgi:hypothetical protein
VAFPWLDLAQFTVLAFKLFYPSFIGTAQTRPFPAITLGLTKPNAKAVRRTTQFACNRRQRRSFALILIAVFQQKPHRAFAELG